MLTYRLIQAFNLLERPGVVTIDPVAPATMKDLLRVHEPEYIEAVRKASEGLGFRDLNRGLGTDDVPIFQGMHEAAARICGASLEAARAVYSGKVVHGVNIAGGLHHAMPDRASGFCVYNDIAVAISWLLEQGVDRIAYVDVDVHHGDGMQEIFWDDPRVMTVSLHESGRTLFPGTGHPEEIGGPGAEGTKVNVSLRAGTDDSGWLRAFDGVVPEVLSAFKPQIIVSQHGCDSHRNDPLANLRLTIEGQRAAYLRIHELAHELCGGRWIATGGGGYDWIDTVPRAWTHLTAIATGEPILCSEEVPAVWRELVENLIGREAPKYMGDGVTIAYRPWDGNNDPLDLVDRAILKTQDAIFPHLGLAVEDPWQFG